MPEIGPDTPHADLLRLYRSGPPEQRAAAMRELDRRRHGEELARAAASKRPLRRSQAPTTTTPARTWHDGRAAAAGDTDEGDE